MASVKTPFRQAEEFLREKIDLPTRTWTDISHGMHARAFVVAGAVEAGLLEDLHGAVIKAGEGGLTRQEFRKEFDQIMAGRGWPFNAPDTPGYRDWRAGVIYDTNLRMAYQAGHWKQMQATAEGRPYLEYSAVLDGKTRPLHREWDGTILPIDHPWWKTHYPPNGWNCRCTVISRSAADLKRLGKAVSVPPPIEPVDRQVTLDGTRATIQVPKGIDPGFDYNVGEAGFGSGPSSAVDGNRVAADWEPLTRFGLSKTTPSDPGPPPVPVRALAEPDQPLDPARPALTQVVERLRALLGGDEKIYTDPTGAKILLTVDLAKKFLPANPDRRTQRNRLLPMIPELFEQPQEIWVGFERNKVTGRALARRRYLRVIEVDLGRGIQRLTGVVDSRGGQPTAITFFAADDDDYLQSAVRTGLRVYESKP